MGKRQKPSQNLSNGSADIPEAFFQRLQRIVPAACQAAVQESFHQPRQAAFRWNPLLSPGKQPVLEELRQLSLSLQPIDWFGDGYFVDAAQRQRLVDAPPVERSEIYLQNPSSYLPCLVLDPQPDEQVLDLAAAPGGKTLLLAALMENRGLISAVEAIRNRFFKLQANLKRYGVTIARTYLTDGRKVGGKVPERFDRVLLDTPCSGESRIHASDPDSYRYWGERKLKEQARKQYGLIRSAFQSLRPGGKMVYCTCSFAPEENECVVSDFLHDHREAEMLAVEIPSAVQVQPGLTEWNGKPLVQDVALSVRILPDSLMNGFFIAAIGKRKSS